MLNRAVLRIANASSSPERRRRAVIALLCGIVAVVCASCSSAGSGSTAGSTATGSNAAKDAATGCSKESTSQYEAALQAPKFTLPAAFSASSMRGKTFAYIAIITNDVVQERYDGFSDGLKSVGAKSIYFDGQGTPDAIAQAFHVAITQRVSGIVTDGFDASTLVKSALASAKAANIPVITTYADDPSAALPDGVVANIAPPINKMGAVQADYALAKTDCKLHVLVVYTSEAQLTIDAAVGLEQEVRRLCPSNCQVTKLDFNAATYQTALTPQVQTALLRDPSINYVVLSGGDVLAPYAVKAVKSLNRKVPIISGEGSGLSEAVHGDGVVADLLWPPNDLAGYFDADGVMRAANGQARNVQLPTRLVDSTNWGDGDINALFPSASAIKNDFKALWGVK